MAMERAASRFIKKRVEKLSFFIFIWYHSSIIIDVKVNQPYSSQGKTMSLALAATDVLARGARGVSSIKGRSGSSGGGSSIKVHYIFIYHNGEINTSGLLIWLIFIAAVLAVI